ncbi:MAG: UDP-2,4-diacetamido-2,4,6-trideoxy-beta-L-altropyranose hydrolase [Arcobacter butzleri]|nr:UDP-2,4-diacetamido-2,4,6-trideoxy-beta-L-altropyranose hydrolase [Aliarcobacter butzleri]
MNILFRVDSSATIGTGHIMRCLALAKEFEKNSVIFATQDLQGNINYKIKEAGYEIKLLKNNSLGELHKLIKQLSINLIIIDSYNISYKFEQRLKKRNPQRVLMVLDDLYKQHHCDILLNHNIYAKKSRYKGLVPKNCDIKCGAKYTLLREEFKKAKNLVVDRSQTSIFVAMGGNDHSNLTQKILQSIQELKKNILINVVTTKANQHLVSLKEYCEDKENIKLHIDSKEIAFLIKQSSLAIITPSVIANEVYYLDVDMIAIQTAKNQKLMYRFLKQNGYFAMKKFDKKILQEGIEKFLGVANGNYKV